MTLEVGSARASTRSNSPAMRVANSALIRWAWT